MVTSECIAGRVKNDLPTYPRPAVSIARFASQLVETFIDENGFPCPRMLEEIPPVPERVQTEFTPAQQAKYKQDAAFAADFAIFAAWLGEPANEAVVRAVDYSYEEERNIATIIRDRLFGFRPGQQRADNAIVSYFKAIDELKEAHLQDPKLEALRKYRDNAQSEADNDFTLQISYDRGLETLRDTSRDLSTFYFRHRVSRFRRHRRFSQPAPEVMRASMPTLRFLAAMAIAKTQAATRASGDFKKFFQYAERDGQQYIAINKKKLSRHIKRRGKFFNHPSTQGRTNNACPALAPVKCIADLGAIEAMFDQEIDVLTEQIYHCSPQAD